MKNFFLGAMLLFSVVTLSSCGKKYACTGADKNGTVISKSGLSSSEKDDLIKNTECAISGSTCVVCAEE